MTGDTVWATVFQGSRLNEILCLISFFLFSLDLQIAVYINLKCLFSYIISLIFTVLILNINFKVNCYDIECALGFVCLFVSSLLSTPEKYVVIIPTLPHIMLLVVRIFL